MDKKKEMEIRRLIYSPETLRKTFSPVNDDTHAHTEKKKKKQRAIDRERERERERGRERETNIESERDK